MSILLSDLANLAAVIISSRLELFLRSHTAVNLGLSSPPDTFKGKQINWIPKRGSSVEHDFLEAVCWKNCLEDVRLNTSRVTSVSCFCRSFILLSQPRGHEYVAKLAILVLNDDTKLALF